MIRFFTWNDVEAVFEENRSSWPVSWNDVKVYSDSVMIYYKRNKENVEESKQYLKEVFTKNYNLTENKIFVDFMESHLEVVFEEDEETEGKQRQYAPLFKDARFFDFRNGDVAADLPGTRILAFHSYKGGVGRTLSLISLLRECTAEYPDKKVLVIDADVEAPGLTWMVEEQGDRSISYLDVLSVMNFSDVTDETINKLAELIKLSTVVVTTDKMNKEQYFIPVYRKKSQVMDIFSSPERILLTKDNKFYITDTISKLGKAVGAELVLIDLRAGITEYSAPFLFDPRVEKYYVTSTSLQSIKGLNQILEQVYGKTKSDFLNSKVLMTMIPATMKEEQVREIEDQILKDMEKTFDTEASTFLRENYIVDFGFEDSLIHLEDFSGTCSSLQGKQITDVMKGIAAELFSSDEDADYEFGDNEAKEILKGIYDIAMEEVTAEGSASTNMLVTSSIKEIARNFKTAVPRIVISGAKGSGKTYIYKQLLSAKNWGEFEVLIEGKADGLSESTLIVPLIASINASKLKSLIAGCIENTNSELEEITIKGSIVNDNFWKLKEYLEPKEAFSQSEWRNIWMETMLQTFGERFHGLSELDEFLERKKKRIVFIVDGLEDLCIDAQSIKSESWKYAIRGICQYMINELDNLDYGNIGILVFARKDMLMEAIETNYEQFRNLYLKYELNWSQTEALRLALWLAAKAYPDLADNINILTATKDILAEKLTRLWGLKLGRKDSKEAFSDRWIMAALSDFTGQLQARDIVRFLKYSTQFYADMKMLYHDRLIMPLDIRNAITPCSADKLTEIKSEMKNIYEILEKFIKMDADKKLLPMTPDKIELTGEQISRLEAQGLLKISDKKYYLPEIIRLALGFKYEKGARPKVLSLLVQ